MRRSPAARAAAVMLLSFTDLHFEAVCPGSAQAVAGPGRSLLGCVQGVARPRFIESSPPFDQPD